MFGGCGREATSIVSQFHVLSPELHWDVLTVRHIPARATNEAFQVRCGDGVLSSLKQKVLLLVPPPQMICGGFLIWRIYIDVEGSLKKESVFLSHTML